MKSGQCWICEDKIEGTLSAIGRSGRDLQYVPFVKDLQPSALLLAHPVCFAEQVGVEGLVAVIHEHDFQMAEKQVPRS